MVSLKILRITEKRVFEHQPLEPFLRSNDLRLSPSSCSFPRSNKPIFLYEITFTLDDVTHIVIERSKNDVIVLVRSVVLYFPSYEFSAQTLFQPPDQHIRDLRELQEFLNRILSIDVTSRIIKYPKIISFFDPVLGRSVVQRSVLKENLQSVVNLEKAIDRCSQRLTTLENVLAQSMDVLRKAQRQEDVEKEKPRETTEGTRNGSNSL